MGQTYKEWKARAAAATYRNSAEEKAVLKAGARIMREHAAPTVQRFNNTLRDLDNEVDASVDEASAVAAEARKALRSASRRELMPKELRQARDRLRRAELNVEREIEEYEKSVTFATTARDDPIAFVDKLAAKFGLDLGLPPI